MHTIARTTALALLAALAALGVAAGTAAPAYACSCPATDTARQARSADLVMVGTLTGVERSEGAKTGSGASVTFDDAVYTFQPRRLYKGEAGGAGPVTVTGPAGPGTCGLGVPPANQEYLVFAVAKQGEYRTNLCAGTSRASAAAVSGIENVLGPGSAAQPPEQPEAQVSRVDDEEPVGFTRLAAPGGALVLLGLLGLFLVRRLRT